MPQPHQTTANNGVITWKVRFREKVDGRVLNRSRSYLSESAAATFCALIDQHGVTRAIEIEDRIAAGPPPEPEPGETLAALGDRWIAAREPDVKAGDITPRTLANYRRDWTRWIRPRLGHLTAELVTDRDVQEWVDWMGLQPRSSHKSIADRRSTLGMIYRWGMSYRGGNVIDRNPVTDIDVPRRGRKPPKGLRVPEYTALLDTAREMYPPAADIMSFLLGTGWRIQEAFALTVGQVEDDGDNVFVTMSRVWRREVGFVEGGKSESAMRRMRVLGDAAGVLRRRVVGKAPGDLVFTIARGLPWDETTFRRDYFNKIAKAAGLVDDRRPTPHWLRHTHVMICHAAGMSMAEISRRLGHADIRITINTYGRMIEDMGDDTARRMEILLTSGQPQVIETSVVAPTLIIPSRDDGNQG